MSLLELENVVTAYGKVEALKGLTLRVEQGEIVALLGSNGAGKSTTLRTISGLTRPRSGTMRFLGQPIDRLSPEAIVKLGVAHVPERRRVFPGLTVRENILLGGSNRARASRRELEANAEQMFVTFPELKPFANVLGWKLSGGQQQMVAIARGLMAQPKLLLLDEPSLGLAPLIVQQVFQIIVGIRRHGTTVLLVEQNAHMALSIVDRGYVLETGRLAAEGNPEALWNNDEVRAAYLGGRKTPEVPQPENRGNSN
jgi:branched-chain amino acid transport system ATP-binding protein